MTTLFRVSWTDYSGQECFEIRKSRDSAVGLIQMLQQDNFVPGDFNSKICLQTFNIPETTEEFFDLFEVIQGVKNEK